ncbi:hypothetical protein CK203_056683 [Vitis vinifera]|uniref:Retrovirus-related Pol polyprotein from transposon RE1 n=1 Tax=Vitis vinifera TaxID=29760 RepID=A0A438GE17_VITVI|nr:hypothetical protein CK203_056683 [Vitis vinifera]
MEEAKVMKTPMSSSIKLDMDEKGKSIDSTMYRGMIGSLLYLTASRPDIMYSGDNFELIGFSDADFAGCRVERKSTSGTCHFLGHSFVSWHRPVWATPWTDFRLWSDFDEFLRLGFHLWTDLDFGSGRVPLCLRAIFWFCSFPARLGLLRVSLLSFPTRFSSPSISPFLDLDGSSKGDGSSRAQGKRLAEPSQQPEQTEARRRRGTIPPSSAQLRIIRGTRRISPRERMTYGLGGPIRTTVRGVEIELSPESICRILDVPPVDAHGMGKPSAHSLTVPSRVLHHMICSILLPRGGHRDEVSYYEAFLVDSLLTGRQIHVGYVMMRHMMSVVRTPPSASLRPLLLVSSRMLGRKTSQRDGGWVGPSGDLEQIGPELDIPAPHQSEGIHVEATFSKPMMTEPSFPAGPSSQPSFTELPSQAPHAPDHPPWMDLSAQINSLGTRMEELPSFMILAFIPWRIASISIRLASPLSLSSSYRD